jgi:hypothetical protein
MGDDELKRLHELARADRKLIRRAADALGELHRSQGLSDEHADVLAALRIRLEGRTRASLDDLLGAAGSIGPKRGLEDALGGETKSSSEWPDVEKKNRDWPGL